MKKFLISILVGITCLTGHAEFITYSVPGQLDYEGAEFWFIKDGDKTNSTVISNFCNNNTMTGAFFKINVTEEAEYVLYLNSAGKGQQLSTDIRNKFDVFIDKGTAEERKVVFLDEVNPGNANIYMMVMVELGTLKEGEHDLQINKTASDWVANPDAGPMILKKDHCYDFDVLNSTDFLNIDVLHPHITSDNRNFTTYVWYRIENSVFGPKDNRGMLLTSDSKSRWQPNSSDVKSYSPVTPTRLRYKIKVDNEGQYQVKLDGQFTLGRFNDSRPAEGESSNKVYYYPIKNYTVNIELINEEGESLGNPQSIIFPDVDPLEEGIMASSDIGRDITNVIEASGTINLPAGEYYMELTASYDVSYPWQNVTGYQQLGEDMLSLRTFTIEALPEELADEFYIHFLEAKDGEYRYRITSDQVLVGNENDNIYSLDPFDVHPWVEDEDGENTIRYFIISDRIPERQEESSDSNDNETAISWSEFGNIYHRVPASEDSPADEPDDELQSINFTMSGAEGDSNNDVSTGIGKYNYQSNSQIVPFEITPGRRYAMYFDPTQKTMTAFDNGYSTGIEDIKDEFVSDEKMYNLFGISVDNNYKGIVIKKGKKYILR